jgi:hypothetical protein
MVRLHSARNCLNPKPGSFHPCAAEIAGWFAFLSKQKQAMIRLLL